MWQRPSTARPGVVHTPEHGWVTPPKAGWYRWGDHAWYTLARRPTPDLAIGGCAHVFVC